MDYGMKIFNLDYKCLLFQNFLLQEKSYFTNQIFPLCDDKNSKFLYGITIKQARSKLYSKIIVR